MNYTKKLILSLVLVAWQLPLMAQVNTSITYQGELVIDGVTADGLYDFSFTLYDAQEFGFTVGELVELNDVTVNQGIFTVELDFGPGVFVGDNLWLEVAVKSSGHAGPLDVLSPRHVIQAAPYALHAEMVAVDAVGGAEILNGSITGDDLAMNTVTHNHIQDGTGSNLDADLLDGMDSLDFAQQGEVTALQSTLLALQQEIEALNNKIEAGPEVLGRSFQSSNGRFNYNGYTGAAAADAMCRDSFNNNPGAHFCTVEEVQRAVASGNISASASNINNVATWTLLNIPGSSSDDGDSSGNNTCQGLLYNTGNAGTGMTLTIHLNQTPPGMGSISGDRVALRDNISCGSNFTVMCCL